MKKLLTFTFTMLLGAGLVFAQNTGGSTDTGKKGSSDSGKKATKVSKAHKGGKGHKGGKTDKPASNN